MRFLRAGIVGCLLVAPAAAQGAGASANFRGQVLPILRSNCLPCHNESKAKARLNLETVETMIAGGKHGPAIIPGDAKASLLMRVASHQEKPYMPSKNTAGAVRLTPAQLSVIGAWIDAGAKGAGAVVSVEPPRWRQPPAAWQPIYALALDARAELVICGRGPHLDVYQVATRRRIGRIEDPALSGAAHRDAVRAMALSPDGQMLATGGYRTIKLWKREMPEQRSKLDLGGAESFALTRDARHAAVALADGEIRIIDLAKDEVVATATGHDGAIKALEFSADGSLLLTGGSDKTIRAWRCADGVEQWKIETPCAVTAAAWLLGEEHVIGAGDDRQLRVWAVAPTEPTAAPTRELKGHGDAIIAIQAHPTRKGEVFSASRDGRAMRWNAQSGQRIRDYRHGVPLRALAVSPDGRSLVTLADNSTARLWDVEAGRQRAELHTGGQVRQAERAAVARVSFLRREIGHCDKAIQTAVAAQKAEKEEVGKAQAAIATAEKEITDKKAAVEKVVQERQGASTELEKVRTAIADAEVRIAKTAKSIQTAGIAVVSKVQADLAVIERRHGEWTKMMEERKNGLDLAVKREQEAQVRHAALAKIVADAKARLASAEKRMEQAGGDAAKRNRAQAEQKSAYAGVRRQGELPAAMREMEQMAWKRKGAEALYKEARLKRDLAGTSMKSARSKLSTAQAARDRERRSLENALRQVEQSMKNEQRRLKLADDRSKAASKKLGDAETKLKSSEQTLTSTQRRWEHAKRSMVAAGGEIDQAKSDRERVGREQEKADTERKQWVEKVQKARRPLRTVSFSRDGSRLVLGAEDGHVHSFAVATGEACGIFRSHHAPLVAAAFTAGGQLVSVAADGSVRNGTLTPRWLLSRTIEAADASAAPVDRVVTLAFSPDARWLASGGGIPSRDGELILWNLADGTVARRFEEAHTDAVYAVAFAADGSRLASASADRSIKVFDLDSGEQTHALEGHTHHVLGLAWHANGRRIATAGGDNEVKIWDLATGKQTRAVKGFTKQVTAVRYLGYEDKFVVTTGGSGPSIVRENGGTERRFSGGRGFTCSIAVSADGSMLAAGGLDGRLHLWKVGDARPVAVFEPEARERSGVEDMR